MLKELIAAALRGLIKELAINPRNLRIVALLDHEEHLLARIDTTTMRDLLNRPAQHRVLRVKLGNIAYDIDLGGNTNQRPRRHARFGQAPKQRGDHG